MIEKDSQTSAYLAISCKDNQGSSSITSSTLFHTTIVIFCGWSWQRTFSPWPPLWIPSLHHLLNDWLPYLQSLSNPPKTLFNPSLTSLWPHEGTIVKRISYTHSIELGIRSSWTQLSIYIDISPTSTNFHTYNLSKHHPLSQYFQIDLKTLVYIENIKQLCILQNKWY